MQFKNFSSKQIKALCWWCNGSPYKDCDALICDGAVRSGKTMCMLISFIAWSFYRFERQQFALCGKTIRSLRRNVITPLTPVLKNMGFMLKEKISQNVVEISKNGRKNYFYLFGGKDESSAAFIQGMTLCGILFDEVALMPQSFVKQAMARCSVKGSKFWFNCNPEYPGHWFYKEWILQLKQKNAYYLHFTMEDNPSLSEQIKSRYKKLYSGTFYDRFILGKWVAAQGVVYPFMEDEGMYCKVPNVEFSKYAVSCDYGTVNPSSFGLWAEFDGTWYRIKEYYYDSKKTGNQRTDEEHYKALCDLVGDLTIESVTVDPSAASFIAVIKKHKRFYVIPAKNNVIDGIRQVSTALKEKQIKICNTCKDSIREFSLYRWETSAKKDSPVKENDHAMDDIRYFVTTIMAKEDETFFAMAARR